MGGRCDIKSVNLLANVLASTGKAGVFEAILVRDGAVTEGSVSNVMVVRNGGLRLQRGHAFFPGDAGHGPGAGEGRDSGWRPLSVGRSPWRHPRCF